MDRENFKRGSFLKLLRTSNHLSERDLAEILDVETSDIAVWETGIKFPEDSATIDKLAKIFHVTKREILNGEYKKEKTTEVEYEKEKVDEDYSLSNTGKNILIVVLTCVIILILFVSIFSVSKGINKKVIVDPSKYFVSDEREEIIHTPKNYTETIVKNTTALSGNKVLNPDILLEYGFTKSGNKYTKHYKDSRDYIIEYCDGKMTLYYISNIYKEIYVKDVNTNVTLLTVYWTKNDHETFEYFTSGSKNCYAYECHSVDDYLKYVNFLSDRIRG